ncbi:hypothetical protein Thiowin_01112 [Thiorhodovibrio winogradskyi]|uniref:Transposase IS4-like domain-containing protein n=2 Tax=Thiorhodovibrio winogradskyi TaxID=77007 RepID=A0ABZ0S533_9GAMM
MTKGVKQSIERLMREVDWCDAGDGCQGAETPLRLQGWGHHRRAIVLRRRIKTDVGVVDERNSDQLQLSFAELTEEKVVYEHDLFITSLANEILTVAQLYRHRADAENPFDELKNHCRRPARHHPRRLDRRPRNPGREDGPVHRGAPPGHRL